MQLDPHSTAYIRPASDLNITYLVFPGSADAPPGPPDLKKLHDRCAALLSDMGGYAGELWEWEDLLAKPAPSPQPQENSLGSASQSSPPPPELSPTSSPSPISTPTPSPSVTKGN